MQCIFITKIKITFFLISNVTQVITILNLMHVNTDRITKIPKFVLTNIKSLKRHNPIAINKQKTY